MARASYGCQPIFCYNDQKDDGECCLSSLLGGIASSYLIKQNFNKVFDNVVVNLNGLFDGV